MTTEIVRVDWVDERVFLLKDHNDFPIVMTQPHGVKGADLLPLGLIGCSAWDLIDILQKQRQQVTGLKVFADSEREETAPWRFTAIHIRYKVSGHTLDTDKVKRAVELTEKKYCSIYATLRDAVELSSEVEIINE